LESLLNYRFGKKTPQRAWPDRLNYIHYDKSITLNETVDAFTAEELFCLKPYYTLMHWSKNINIFITIDQLHEFLVFFGYDYNIEDFDRVNVSQKERGTFNETIKERVKEIYKKDIKLYESLFSVEQSCSPTLPTLQSKV
jgi:hypothetical protein